MTGFYKDYADSSDTHQNSAEASADAAEVSANEAAASAAAAQDLEVTSASFDTNDGTLTLTKANSGTVTTDFDGRYAELTGGASFSGGNFSVNGHTPDTFFIERHTSRVGIRTNDPHNALHVEGKIKVRSHAPTIYIEDTDEGATDYSINNVNGEFSIREQGLTQGTDIRIEIEDTGDVNINPHYDSGSFNVNGDSTFDGSLTVDTDTLYVDATNNKVGINTTTPSEALDVTGNSVVSGDATVGGELTVTGNAEAELFKGDLEGAVHFKGATNGDTLTKGDVVYVSGYSGGKTVVGLADASDSSKMPAFGIVAADPVGVNVDVVTFGTLKSIDTSTYTDGDELYVDTTAGGLTATAPSGEGNLVQKIAKVVRADNSGNIKVMGAGRTNATPNLNDGNIFIGDSNNLATTASFATEVTNATAGKANLSGATFTGTVGIGSLGSPQTLGVYGATSLYNELNVTGDITATNDVSISGTLNTDNLTTTYNSVDYSLINMGQLTPVFPAMEIGGTESGNKIYTVEMRPAAGGVRMHWHQNTDNISGQTLRFHTTDRGVHVGDDRTGTYTAGDLQNNQDIDFGMLVGRESANLGSNNFGFGYDIDFSVDTASNLGAGSLIDVYEDTVNSVAFGGAVRLGKSVSGVESGVTASFVGGNIARTEGDYSFTWGKGELDANGIYPTVNKGYGCVLFGHITDIDEDSTWSMVGGDIGDAGQTTSINDTHYSLVWGKNAQVSNSSGAAVFGNAIAANYASYSLISGNNNAVFATSCVVGGISHEVGYQTQLDTRGDYSACFGTDHLVEGRRNFVAGHDNNSLGESGACIGQGLKTPLFQPVGGGAFVWDDYSVVVGGYNDEAHKYYTNTNNTAWVEDHRFVVGTGTSSGAKDNGFIVAVPDSGFCGIIMPNLASSPEYASDTAAKAGGVPVGGLYRDGNTVKIVLS